MLVGCGVNELEPPATPGRAPVTISAERVPQVRPPLTGRVALDAVGGESRVEEVTELSAGFEMGRDDGAMARVITKPLCISPCVADFNYGNHILRYTSMNDDGNVSFAPLVVKKGSVTIVRHAPGHYRTHRGLDSGGTYALVVGLPVFFLGMGMLVVGKSNLGGELPGAGDARDSLASGGGIAMGIGAAVAALGAVLKVVGRDEYQPGSTMQWDEPDDEDVKPAPKEPPAAPPPAASSAAPPATPPATTPAAPSIPAQYERP